MLWTGLIRFRIGISGELCEHGNEPSGSINFWEEQLAAPQERLGSIELVG
jgi:hypothetical protein